MLTSTYLVSTDKRLRAYLIGGLIALMVVAGSLAYEVKPGDTLSGIAAKHGVSLQALLESNDIANPDLILPGQKINIPGSGGSGGGGTDVHVVEAGETLGVIAARYKATVAAIAKANDLKNPNLIRVGQKLTIPAGGGGGGGSSSSGFHIVKAGETLGTIARKYGLSVSALAEANGISVQEAMMAGLPVICLKWGGPELLADAGSAVLIDPGEQTQVVRDVAAAMTSLAADPDAANRIATRARVIAERRFSWDDVAREWQGDHEPR